MTNDLFSCDFCNKSFKREKTFFAHMCEGKRRWLSRDEKHVIIGFIAYKKFMLMSYKTKRDIKYEEFMKSRYYIQFVKFGRFCKDINVVNINGYIEFVIKSNIKITNWTTDEIYEKWIRELSKKENSEVAVERSILLMKQWSDDTNNEWYDFFRKVSTTLATKWIKSGRLSPWILYTVGNDLIERLSLDQINIIKNIIDPIFWQKKFQTNQKDVEFIKNTMEGTGI